jgi:DNA-binding NarL/FixJ family response regulator
LQIPQAMYLMKEVLPAIAQILIVDDHEMIREGIRTLLSSRPHWRICGEAVDGLDALEKAKTLRPDIVLMDISMPRMDGLTALRILKRNAPGARVIIVTQNDAAEHRKEGVRADGYVLKARLHRDLLPTLERVLQNEAADAADVPDPATGPASLGGSHEDE